MNETLLKHLDFETNIFSWGVLPLYIWKELVHDVLANYSVIEKNPKAKLVTKLVREINTFEDMTLGETLFYIEIFNMKLV